MCIWKITRFRSVVFRHFLLLAHFIVFPPFLIQPTIIIIIIIRGRLKFNIARKSYTQSPGVFVCPHPAKTESASGGGNICLNALLQNVLFRIFFLSFSFLFVWTHKAKKKILSLLLRYDEFDGNNLYAFFKCVHITRL